MDIQLPYTTKFSRAKINNIKMIDPILKDRITVIETPALHHDEKIIICKDFLMPDILKNTGFRNNDIQMGSRRTPVFDPEPASVKTLNTQP